MVKVEVFRIIIDEVKREQLLVLKEKSGSRIFPMVVGLNEAEAIRMTLNKIAMPRPMTHDLMNLLIANLGANLEKVVIDKLIEGTFYATLYLKTNNATITTIDARPSDAVALAVRKKCAIFIEEAVIKQITNNDQ